MSTPELVRVRRRLERRPDQIAEARHLISRVVGTESPAHDVARLLVSEAATNALLHSASGELGGSLEVRCQLEDRRRLRVEVRDQGSAKSRGQGPTRGTRSAAAAWSCSTPWPSAGAPAAARKATPSGSSSRWRSAEG
jgi:Histidine kinase-like ATPase domain